MSLPENRNNLRMPSVSNINILNIRVKTEEISFGKRKVLILSAPGVAKGDKLEICDALNPTDQEYLRTRGGTLFDYVVRFGNNYAELRGTHDNPQSIWTPENFERLQREGIVSLQFSPDSVIRQQALDIRDAVGALAHNPLLQADDEKGEGKKLRQQYGKTAINAYGLLGQHAKKYGMEQSPDSVKVSIVRAGLVGTRLATYWQKWLEEPYNPEITIENELAIDVKRLHFKDEPHGAGYITIALRLPRQGLDSLQQLHGTTADISDFVSATGGSVSGLAAVLKANDIYPEKIIQRNAAITTQSTIFNQAVYEKWGINNYVYNVFTCNTLNDKFYLSGPGEVNDAGDATAHMLPQQYRNS